LRSFLAPAPEELARIFPQLEVLEFVGQGGMGAVYKARQPALDRLVAIKVLPPEAGRDPAFADRFTREALSLARFNHPNILAIYDFGEADGLFYIIMEFVAGKDLRQLLRTGPLTEALSLPLIAQVCDALQYAHNAGVVHRDIKPENILLDARGQVKIADFGLAKLVGLPPAYLSLTSSRDVMGTVYYMAPEQLLQAHHVDHRADLYSLGVVLYEMLTGELPVGRFAPPSQRAKVDARLDAIVLRALAPKPEDRYQDAIDIKREVEAVFAGEPAVPTATQVNWPFVRFTIPMIDWMGGSVQGELFRDEATLYLDFSVVSAMGSSTHKEVRLPLEEIHAISCHTDPPRWINAWRRTEIILKVSSPDALAELPAGQHGRGRLRVHRADREAAEQLVDSIRRIPRPARATPRPSPAGQGADPDRVRRQLLAPAAGLLLTAAVALVSTLVLAVVLARRFDPAGNLLAKCLVGAGAFVLMPLGVWLMVDGALRMLRGRSYTFCVAAALVALLPWSPAWLLGLPVGIGALVVLGRPEVMRAFLRNREGAVFGLSGSPQSPGPVAGKLRGWFRSIARYFVTIPGKHAQERDARDPRRTPE
jgi:serine/threonine protein kinase